MAKMFYTLEEVCEKLQKSESEIHDMVAGGQLQEFRDRDKLMFKVDQVSLLAGGDEDTGDVVMDLDDSGSSGSAPGLSANDSGILGLSGSGSLPGMPPPSGSGLLDGSGSHLGLTGGDSGAEFGVMDTDHGGEDDEAGDTRVGEGVEDELSLESVGSGSGLLDLTRESDDTSLGAELLEEVYSSDENFEIPASASGLFEAQDAGDGGSRVPEPAAAISSMPVMAATIYEGGWSGLAGGLMIGAALSLIFLAVVLAVVIMGNTSQLATMMTQNLWMWIGGIGGVTVLCALVGFFLGRASE